VKVGGLVRFDRAAVDRWLDDNQRGPGAPASRPATISPVRSMSRRRSAQTAPQPLSGQLRLDK
jgi:hypothetical protein